MTDEKQNPEPEDQLNPETDAEPTAGAAAAQPEPAVEEAAVAPAAADTETASSEPASTSFL